MNIYCVKVSLSNHGHACSKRIPSSCVYGTCTLIHINYKLRDREQAVSNAQTPDIGPYMIHVDMQTVGKSCAINEMHYTMIIHFLLDRPISRVLVPYSLTSWLSVKLRRRVGTLTILPQISTTVLATVQATVQALLDMVVVYNLPPARMTWSHKKLQVCSLKTPSLA